MPGSELPRPVHSHLSHITWLQSHHVIPQSCFCTAACDTKMNDSLYMLKWSNRSYLARYTIILITSRDCNHITWFRNSASVSLLATLSHRTWIANDFSSSQLSQKRSKISDCTFWKISYKRKFSFLLISCTRNRYSTVIESYIRKNDVIKCELDLALTEKLIQYLTSQMTVDCCREREETLIDFHRLLLRDTW